MPEQKYSTVRFFTKNPLDGLSSDLEGKGGVKSEHAQSLALKTLGLHANDLNPAHKPQYLGLHGGKYYFEVETTKEAGEALKSQKHSAVALVCAPEELADILEGKAKVKHKPFEFVDKGKLVVERGESVETAIMRGALDKFGIFGLSKEDFSKEKNEQPHHTGQNYIVWIRDEVADKLKKTDHPDIVREHGYVFAQDRPKGPRGPGGTGL